VESASERAQRDAELKAYLERVPELTKYRYSPLDRDKEPRNAPVDPAPRAHP
jgi:hypothetical protein